VVIKKLPREKIPVIYLLAFSLLKKNSSIDGAVFFVSNLPKKDRQKTMLLLSQNLD
jgi:hypothetical protein